MLGIGKNKAYLKDFYKAKSMEDKAAVVDKYEREKLNMTADVNIKDDDRNYFPVHSQSPLSKKFYKSHNEDKDVRYLCQDCMCHHCNKFCLQDNKKNQPRTCRVGFGDEKHFGRQDKPGMNSRNETQIEKDKKGICHFRIR